MQEEERKRKRKRKKTDEYTRIRKRNKGVKREDGGKIGMLRGFRCTYTRFLFLLTRRR